MGDEGLLLYLASPQKPFLLLMAKASQEGMPTFCPVCVRFSEFQTGAGEAGVKIHLLVEAAADILVQLLHISLGDAQQHPQHGQNLSLLLC